jgi:hypothetical protein
MGRTPHAAVTLRDQINDKLRRDRDGAKAAGAMTPVDEPDGLDAHRSFEFDETASKMLAGLLPNLSDDRIVDYEIGGSKAKPKVTVTFAATYIGDDRTPFPLDAVDAPDEEGAGDEAPPA